MNIPTSALLPFTISEEFQINTYTDSTQSQPSVTSLADGSFIVTWTSYLQDGSGNGIYGQKFNSNGSRLGNEFQINTYITDDQISPSVTSLADQGFVVTWQSLNQDGSGNGIYGQRFDNNTTPIGNEFQINTYTKFDQYLPSVTSLADGGFVVAWESVGSGYGVYGQRFDDNGIRAGNEFQINTYSNNARQSPSVTSLADGGFIVAWGSYGQDGSGYGIYGQRFDGNGDKVGNEFQINTYTDNEQKAPSVTSLADGGFVATWESWEQDGSRQGVYGQRFDGNGDKVGEEFQINTYTNSRQYSPSVTSLADDNFVVTWNSYGQEGSSAIYGLGVYGQIFDHDGTPIDDEFQINTYINNHQQSPSVASLPEGGFVVAWNSVQPQDGSDYGVYGRLYGVENTNSAPIAVDDTAITNQNQSVAIAVLGNDTDSDEDDLTISNFDSSSTNGGTITVNNENELVYTPTANFVGEDTFTYTITDGTDSDNATVTVTVEAIASNGWHTQGNQIIDPNGEPFTIQGVNWFGMETDYYAPHGLWERSYQDLMDQIKELGYNTIRLPFSNETLRQDEIDSYFVQTDLQDLKLKPFDIMDRVINYAEEIGLYIILDRHHPFSTSESERIIDDSLFWYTDEYPESTWIEDWQILADRYADKSNIIGADLDNEPYGATWGDGNRDTDWQLAAERAGNAILEVNPNWLIFVEGIQYYDNQGYWWGGNLMGVEENPVELNIDNRVVYSAHDYPHSVSSQSWFSEPDYPNNLPDVWDQYWGYIHKQEIAPVLLGEFGTKLETESDQQWFNSIAYYIKENNLNWTYWSFNPNSGDTGGILQDDWVSVNQNKQDILTGIIESSQFSFDIDGDGEYSANIDGLLLYGYLNIRGIGVPALVNNLTQQLADNLINPNSNPTRTTGAEIADYLESNIDYLDIDGDGDVSANIDGLLAYGYFNIRGIGVPALINNLTQQLADNLIPDDSTATRTTATNLVDYFNNYII